MAEADVGVDSPMRAVPLAEGPVVVVEDPRLPDGEVRDVPPPGT